jgi:molybdopterin-guanine dinucleotide biosynthesis protein A
MKSVAILAGGRASRFGGRDKSALVVDGRTILETQLARLATVAEDVMVIRAADDVVPGCGPLGGLHAALTRARGDAVLLVACDMPFVTAELASYLLSLASPDVDIVVPFVRRRPQDEPTLHPLCAVYGRTCLDAVARRLADRRLKMIELVEEMRTRLVTDEELGRFGDVDRLFANVNTPA